jgi:TetR/AcrR family transcriptional regulator, fatty acid metabolism regulator protein
MRLKTETLDQDRPSFIEAARRAQIIECAIDAIAELGFGQASLAQIAKRAEVSTGVISYHFAGKDALIRAVMTHVYVTGGSFIQPRVDYQNGARAALCSYIAASVGFVAAYPNHTRAMMNIILGGNSELYNPALDEPRRAGFRRILELGQGSGEFRSFDVSVMVGAIIGALNTVPLQLAAGSILDLAVHGRELVELFDRATRKDAP